MFCAEDEHFGAGDEHICAGDEHLISAGDERVENAPFELQPQTHKASKQRLPNRTEMSR